MSPYAALLVAVDDHSWLSGLAERLQGYADAPAFAPLAFVVAFLAGAGHALAPGHGKSLAAAYLVGTEGRIRDALWLGGSVAVMHTASVLVLAVAWTFLSLSDAVGMQSLTEWLQLAAGVIALAVGAWLLWTAVAAIREGERGHGHGHGHGHGRSGGDDEGAAHGSRGPSRPTLVLLGVSGGLVPSPTAFLVLVTGLFSGTAAFALLLVATFGLGLASVLVTVGLLALGGRNVVARAAETRPLIGVLTRAAPLLSAIGITVLGCALTTLAVTGLTG